MSKTGLEGSYGHSDEALPNKKIDYESRLK